MQRIPTHVHKWIYFFGLSVIAIGLAVSEFLMSIGQFIILGNWLLEGQIIEKVKIFWKNKAAVVVSSVILMHLIGLFYTEDFEYAFNDIRIKAPLLVLPFLISTSVPLSKSFFNWLMIIFVATVVVGTIISMGVYYGIIHTKFPVNDIRDISIFISHIRFSLLVCFSIFVCAWFLYSASSILIKFLCVIVIGWLVIFLSILDSLTGVVALAVVTFIILLYTVFTLQKPRLKIVSLTCVTILIVSIIQYLKPLVKLNSATHTIDVSRLDQVTSQGGIYQHYINNLQTENGYRLWINVCWKELEQSWNNRSTTDFYGKNFKGEDIRVILIRYLTSKGLRKDAAAVNSLIDKEIQLIEQGVANVNYVGKSSTTKRILETLWEFENFKRGGDINGHSTVMRLEFWKTGLGIWLKEPLLGVGTGDVKKSYIEQYDIRNSSLDKRHRLRAHNQYLSIAIAFGVVGLVWFMLSLFYPFILFKLWNDYLYFTFFLIALLSFLNEDTLETQPGATFFAFFNALLLFGRKDHGSSSKTSL